MKALIPLFLLCLILSVTGVAICHETETHSRAWNASEFVSFTGVPADSADTLRYDDGTPSYGLWLPGEDAYWAMKFTPAIACSLIEAHCFIWVFSGPAPTCTLIIWDDNGGEPGNVIHSTTFVPSTELNVVNITPPVAWAESVDFWIGYYLKTPESGDTALAVVDSGVDYNERNGIYVLGGWYTMDDVAGEGDLLIRALVEYSVDPTHDVGMDSIVSPPDTVIPGSSWMPLGWVHNYGEVNESFLVECTIEPTLYVDTVSITSLPPAGETLCEFNAWNVPLADSTAYTVCMRTILVPDTNSVNDTLCKSAYSLTRVYDCYDRPVRGLDFSATSMPNPFSERTCIHFNVGSGGRLKVIIQNAAGSPVRLLADHWLNPGSYVRVWDCTDDSGSELPGGVYFCSITDGLHVSTTKLVVIR